MTENTAIALTKDQKIDLIRQDPKAAFQDKDAFEVFFAHVRETALNEPVDLTTAKGREHIASTAFKVTKTKTTIDKAAGSLTEDAKKLIAEVNESKKDYVGRLEELAKEIRKPLTDWENEQQRQQLHVSETHEKIKRLSIVDATSSVEALIKQAEDLAALAPVVKADYFGDFSELYGTMIETGGAAINQRIEAVKKAEADRIELEALRKAQAERDAAEEKRKLAEQEKAEALEREQREKDLAEQREKERLQKIAAEQEAEKQRIADAQEVARKEEAERIQAEADARVKAAEEEAERIRSEAEAKAKQQAEHERAEKERQQNREHQSKILAMAKEDLMTECEVSEETARIILLQIRAGKIRNLSVNF